MCPASTNQFIWPSNTVSHDDEPILVGNQYTLNHGQ